jgi:alanine-alpha-ketoisovalerate/valine-pyruvate aminotransferase
LGVSNIFGSSNFTLHVTDYKQTAPELIQNYIKLYKENYTINLNILFKGLIENEQNVMIQNTSHKQTFYASNVYGSTEVKIEIYDYLAEEDIEPLIEFTIIL